MVGFFQIRKAARSDAPPLDRRSVAAAIPSRSRCSSRGPLSVGLMSAICLFLVGAGPSMTEQAVAAVPIDWQVQLMPGADAKAVGRSIKQAIHGADVHDVHYADTDALKLRRAERSRQRGPVKSSHSTPPTEPPFPRKSDPSLEGSTAFWSLSKRLQISMCDQGIVSPSSAGAFPQRR